MSNEPNAATVHILDKEYRFTCPAEEQQLLIRSARHLDNCMQEIRDSGKAIGMDRIAIMAALNLAHELLALKDSHVGSSTELSNRLKNMREKVETILTDGNQKELL